MWSCISSMASWMLSFKAWIVSLACQRNTYLWRLPTSLMLCTLKSTPNDIFLNGFSWQILFTLRGFARNLLRGNRWKNVFIFFRFDIWPGILNSSLTSNKPRLRRLLMSLYVEYNIVHMFGMVFLGKAYPKYLIFAHSGI